MHEEIRDKLLKEVRLSEKDWGKQIAYINGILDFYNEVKEVKNGKIEPSGSALLGQ